MVVKSKFHIDVYDCDVIVHISDDLTHSVNTYLKKFGDESDVETGCVYNGYFMRPQNSLDTYIVFYQSDSINQENVNHEKSHLVEQILVDRDIPSLGEPRAYLDAFISKKLNALLKKKGFKIKD